MNFTCAYRKRKSTNTRNSFSLHINKYISIRAHKCLLRNVESGQNVYEPTFFAVRYKGARLHTNPKPCAHNAVCTLCSSCHVAKEQSYLHSALVFSFSSCGLVTGMEATAPWWKCTKCRHVLVVIWRHQSHIMLWTRSCRSRMIFIVFLLGWYNRFVFGLKIRFSFGNYLRSRAKSSSLEHLFWHAAVENCRIRRVG